MIRWPKVVVECQINFEAEEPALNSICPIDNQSSSLTCSFVFDCTCHKITISFLMALIHRNKNSLQENHNSNKPSQSLVKSLCLIQHEKVPSLSL